MNLEAIRAAMGEAKDETATRYGFAFRDRKQDDDTDWPLLAQVFGYHEKFDDPRDPFRPRVVFEDGRSPIPADLTDDQLDALSEVVTKIDDPEFSARINDVLWLRRRDHEAARHAVDGYMASALRLQKGERWKPVADRYSRALRLARQVDRKGSLPDMVAGTLIERVRHHADSDDTWLTQRLLVLLYEARKGEPVELAAVAQQVADLAEASSDWRRQRDYLDVVVKFYGRAADTAEAEAARVAIVLSYIAEAENAETNGGGMLSHHHWEHALKGARERPSLRERVPELRTRLAAAGRTTLESMSTFEHSTDVTPIVEDVKGRIESKAFDEALYEFALFQLMDPDELRTQAEDRKDGMLAGLFGSSYYDYEGRVVAVAPGAAFPTDPGYETQMRANVQRDASMRRGLGARAQIATGLQILNAEHVYDVSALEGIMGETKLVPEDRVPLLLRGLAAGFEWDFTLAVHLLIPQLEAGLRHIAEQSGITPRNLNAAGIEEAWGFDRLLTDEGVAPILGKPLTFELRSLFIDDFGPKFRHNVAHGLVPPGALEGQDALYAWWLCLRTALVPCAGFRAYFDELVTEHTASSA